MDDEIRYLVAAIDRARHPVVNQRRRPGLAAQKLVADLGAIAEEAVAAGEIIRGVDDGIGTLIAAVCRTRDPVIEYGRRSGATAEDRIAELGAVAE